MTDREILLMEALESILVANGVIIPNMGRSGPELLVATKDFVDHINSQEIKDREYFEKYGIKYHRNMKHGVCPRCGSTDVCMNDNPSEADSECHFSMICEDCDKRYQAVYTFSYCVTTK